MRVLGTHAPAGPLPENLQALDDLARDLRWTWRPSLRALFTALDPQGWERARGNPVELLAQCPPERLLWASADPSFLSQLSAARSEIGLEDDAQPAHPAIRAMRQRGDLVAYFSAEFGLTEALPIYAGGLGVLAGDHLKSASDLGLPLVGVGLFYGRGYFRQSLHREEGQREGDALLDPDRLPISLPRPSDGGPPLVTVTLGERDVRVLIRLVTVGRVPLLLLDTNLEDNHPEDREVTARLYGGDQETRIRQEIVLGIGGLRALERMQWRPTIRHLNEGHAAFVVLERIRQIVAEEGLSFGEARERAAAGNVFTTHTPVPAGIDRFLPDLLEKYLKGSVAGAGLQFEDFLRLGQEAPGKPDEPFSMAVLALRLSGHANAVSRLHAKVSRRLWLGLLPELADDDVKIRGITNGVHRATWTDPDVASLSLVENAEAADPAVFWRLHERLRERLIGLCRRRIAEERREQGASSEEVESVASLLHPRALTVGFARRFATYKRATLLFRDPERLRKILHAGPVQILFAGKAHPRDEAGKELLRAVSHYADLPEFRGHVVLVPDYDMAFARALVAGCDVWLNNPIRPHEASGTSGMKAAMNGGLNLSVLDGWWDEAPYNETGFVIGTSSDYDTDDQVAASLYRVLEEEVLPLFLARDEKDVPREWVRKMIQSASLIGRQFSSDRMVTEYLELCYVPAAERKVGLFEDARERLRPVGAGASKDPRE
jgi:starch phosphorylase